MEGLLPSVIKLGGECLQCFLPVFGIGLSRLGVRWVGERKRRLLTLSFLLKSSLSQGQQEAQGQGLAVGVLGTVTMGHGKSK